MKKLSPLTSLLLLSCLSVFAQQESGSQKLKDVQSANLRAPSPLKIDGKLSEWNDSFQAYNKSTKLYYTLSNDDKCIYLAIKSVDAINNTKIIAGGITLAINTAGKKKEKEAYNLTFPVIARPARGQQGQRGGGGFGGGGFGGPGGPFGGQQGGVVDSAAILAAHTQTITASKEIKIYGFKGIQDSIISIYNEYGIKAAIGYDAKGNYTYELAIPLKYLDISVDNPKEIAYNIKVNGLQINFRPGGGDGGGARGGGGGGFGGGPGGGGGFGGGGGGGFGGPGGGGFGGGGNTSFQEMISPSDFWGKYTLAKK